jgi:uncharacterized protein (TIGR03435 family)
VFLRILSLVLISLAAYGQTFEAASIKPATPLGPQGFATNQNGGPGTTDPDLFKCQNCSLSWIMGDAYRIHGYDFSGPDWLGSTRFDFTAKLPAGATKEEFQTMLQNLLADRFKLTVHREKRQMPVYEMTVAKNGPKFRDGSPKDAPTDDGPSGKLKRDDDGFPILPPGTVMAIIPGHARLRSDNRPMEWFTEMLAGQLHSPIVDATGLKGEYDFVVSWAWEEDSTNGPSILADALIGAVQSQLGLKLERKKGQAEMLVVDHMEKTPTEN